MKEVIISGSLAYDRIMTFPDFFSNHILPEEINKLNVAFMVDGVTENFGGTAGNIAYAANLMGEQPTISATIGSDNLNYMKWLQQNSIKTNGICIIEKELTAGAYITTDKANNQITNFNPGAMKHSSELDFLSLDPEKNLLLVSPGNLDDMKNYPTQAKKKGLSYIFDPGQALPVIQPADLIESITGAMLLIVNEYEFSLILDKTKLARQELLDLPEATIITLGGDGSEIYKDSTKSIVPPCKAQQVVDPTGAGDAYRGGLISGLLQGKDLLTCAYQGSVCGSFAVECNGTQDYSFTPQEFQQRIRTI